MKPPRHFLWLLLLLIPALWWAWPSASDKPADRPEQLAPRGPAAGGPASAEAAEESAAPARTKARRAQAALARTPQAPSFPEIDQILTDDQISTAAAAIQLREITNDSARPVAQRIEALAHGLNLDTAAFQSLATDPELPAEMALPLLHAFINHNESPASQIQVFMALLNHSDEEVSTEARSMLAFQVGDDTGELDPAQLIPRANEKLRELAAEAGQ